MPDLPERDAPEPTDPSGAPRETDTERRRRRDRFLRELAEARELRDRVQPRRAKSGTAASRNLEEVPCSRTRSARRFLDYSPPRSSLSVPAP